MDKKEKRDQKDPEKELADSALQPYRRPYVAVDFSSSDSFRCCLADVIGHLIF